MRWFRVLLLSVTIITLVSCHPEKKKSLLSGLGKLLKDVLVTTTTTTTPSPGFVDDLLNRGKLIAKQQYKTHRKTIVGKIGEYAEQAGVNRGIAEAVSSQMIKDGIKKGKAYIEQRRNSTSSVHSTDSEDGISHTQYQSGRMDTNQRVQQQHQQTINLRTADELIEEPVMQKKVESRRGGYGA